MAHSKTPEDLETRLKTLGGENFSDSEWAEAIARFREVEDGSPYPADDSLNAAKLAGYIDHTLLKLDATEDQIDTLCDEAKIYGFASCCVRPRWVSRVAANLKGTDVKVCTVIGFPEGYFTSHKIAEAVAALHYGAQELDMVIDYPALKAGEYASVFLDIDALRKTPAGAHYKEALPNDPNSIVLKVILETSQLSPEEIRAGVYLAAVAGADFVKTSTGFLGRGASVEDVRIMRQVADGVAACLGQRGAQVKASGGIRTVDDCKKMIEAGATRIGASAGVAILKELEGEQKEKGAGEGEAGY